MGSLKFKVVFLGDQSVGKTSIILQFINGSFDPDYQSTIGIDFQSKSYTVGEKSVRLQLWDTAGQERFHSLVPSYIKNSQIAIIVYDICNRKSFESAQAWVDKALDVRGSDILIAMVGNKCDLEDKRQVSKEELERKCKQLGITVY